MISGLLINSFEFNLMENIFQFSALVVFMDKSTLSVLIGIFLITMPAALGSLHDPSEASVSQTHDFYDFSSLAVGSTPTGNSWIDFKTVNDTPKFAYSIKNTAYGNALHITSCSDTIQSYLDMQINYSMPVSVSFYFMWNDSSPSIYKFNRIFFMEGSTDIFEYSFGVRNNALSSGFNTSAGDDVSSFVPEHNDLYRANVSFDPSVGEMSFEIRNENTGNTSFPMFFNGITPAKNSNLSILFGGLISAIYVYNLTVENSPENTLPENTAGNLDYISNSSIISSGYSPYDGNETHPFLDIPLNTVIYVLENGSVAGYNYFDHSSYIISEYSNGSFQDIETLQSGYSYEVLWFQAGGLLLRDIDTMNLSVRNESFSGDFSGFYSLLSYNDTVLYNSSGYLYDISMSEPGDIFSSQVLPGGYSILSISQGSQALDLSSTDGNRIIDYTVALPSLSASETGESYTGNYWVGFDIASYVEGNYGVMSIIRSSGISLNGDLLTPSGHPYYIPGGFSVLGSGSSSTILINGTSSFMIIGNNTYGTNMELPSGSRSIYFASNASVGVDITNDTITVLHVNADYFSDYRDRINGITTYMNQGFVFNVTSMIPYTITSYLGNKTFVTGETDFLAINLTDISSGHKVLESGIHNAAGYSSYFNYSFVVDNGIPVVSITPLNGSYVAQNATFNVSVTDTVPIDYVNVTLLNHTVTYYSGSFVISPELYSFTGELNITIFIMDNLGHNFTRYFIFKVMNESVNGFSWNLNSQNYLSSGNLSLMWVPIANITRYSVIFSGVLNETFTTSSAQLNVTLANGDYSVEMVGYLRDGLTTILGRSNITVITYRPGIAIKTGNESYYSFHGNSLNSTFNMTVSSNITSMITVKGILPNGTNFLRLRGNSFISVTIGKSFQYNSNGVYSFAITAESLSGTWNSTVFNINVNNTVPVLPVMKGIIYTNQSALELPFNIIGGVNYTAFITHNGTPVEIENLTGSTLDLIAGQGTYSINFTAFSISGNHASSLMVVDFYFDPPVISMQISSISLIDNNFTLIHYEINDSVPLQNITLHENNISREIPLGNNSGNIKIDFAHNGNYSFYITALDMCGNMNSSYPHNVSVQYYDNITGSNIRISIVGNSANLESVELGNYSDNLQFAWYLNGKYEGNSSTINLNLPYGYSNVTLMIRYNGKTLEVSRKVLTLGWIPEIAAMAAITGTLSIRTFRIRRKMKKAMDLVISSKGKSVKDVVVAGKKTGIPGSAVKKAAAKLASAGKISFDRDLDNNLYIKKS
jgi:hypothetical protein